MASEQAGGGRRTSAARARLLGTATRIFYTEGIHSVGVDRIIAEAQVTRATLYRHFTGKEELVLAYIDQADQGMRAGIEAARSGKRTAAGPGDGEPADAGLADAGPADAGPATGAPAPGEPPAGEPSAADAVRAVARFITDGIRSPGFRGCAFLNAAAEYPDPAHPIHQAVLAHRQWFLETVTGLLARVGDEPADEAGRHFVMLRDGAMAAGCLFDPELITETFLRGVEGILRVRGDRTARAT
ncbi:putative transcriptional regulator [Actinacidiphila reveromycinica]|uniref:Putative transcriptional regulator n=1 Tax=Actinacidiphila reveromycinica TaxID=659352 RepID=A0A7U3UTM0_9ACTN|nr:TetR/AcrR family transcriptional regulator [Streptomyces sp. SN-593]BBA98513.1 putative transcriptional regulator [Streptomyces sp. SN-593]